MKSKNFRTFGPGKIATALAFSAAALLPASRAHATAYASGITFTSPTAVSFTLNEAASSLFVSINGGAPFSLDGSAKGTKSFTLNSATDKFSITAITNDLTGYTIPTGGIIIAPVAPNANGLSQDTLAGGFRQLSNDADSLVKFNSPRGVAVANDPNNPFFGTAYIANSLAATAPRSVGDGLYALKADQSDAFGYGITAKPTGFESAPSQSSPYRLTVGSDNNVYVADFSDQNGGVYRMNGNLTASTQVLAGIGGPTPPPAGQNHGSTTAVYVSGSTSGNNLTVYTVDEDLTSSQFTPGASTGDRNSLWRYDIGGSALPFAGTPTKINLSGQTALLPAATSDLDRGANGNFYLAQNRAAGNEAGVLVLSPDGSLLFSSLTASRALLGNQTAPDILRNVLGIAISLDQTYLAAVLNNSDIAIIPLDANGIPNLASRLLIDTGVDSLSGRDIAFDAAGNIHYVSSGQALYKVLAPGGSNSATTSWNGSVYSFAVTIPEPSSLLLLGSAGMLLIGRRRRAVR